MKTISFRLTSVSPLLMHNAQLADPLNKFARELKRILSKRKKTDADHEEVARLEFLGGFYAAQFGNELHAAIPGTMVEATLVNAAKTLKMGRQARSGIIVRNDSKLIYKGPADPNELYRTGFVLRVPARVGTSRVMRTRPCFRDLRCGGLVL